jgi:hypothetical protein
MQTDQILTFFSAVDTASRARWHDGALRQLAHLAVPEGLLGNRANLVRADITLAQARWYLEGLVDFAEFEQNESLRFGHLASQLWRALRAQHPKVPYDEIRDVALKLATIAWGEIEGRRTRQRARMTLDVRRTLWFTESDPRCYLCGYRFTVSARDRFLRRGRGPVTLPSLVDFTRPRTKERHLTIEIDHVRAVADGGANDLDNLRLSCGWCNSVKGRRGSIFDVDSRPIGMLDHPTLGWVSVPQPMWVLRIVSMRGRCEHASGCSARLTNCELFVAPAAGSGALNPANTLVLCVEHDPWKDDRLVNPARMVR